MQIIKIILHCVDPRCKTSNNSNALEWFKWFKYHFEWFKCYSSLREYFARPMREALFLETWAPDLREVPIKRVVLIGFRTRAHQMMYRRHAHAYSLFISVSPCLVQCSASFILLRETFGSGWPEIRSNPAIPNSSRVV